MFELIRCLFRCPIKPVLTKEEEENFHKKIRKSIERKFQKIKNGYKFTSSK